GAAVRGLVPPAQVVVDVRLARGTATAGVADVALLVVRPALVGTGRLVARLGHDAPPPGSFPARALCSSPGSTSAPAVPAAAQPSTTSQDSGSSGVQPKNRDRPGVWTTTPRT